MADSIVDLIERSQDLLAERNGEEIRRWISPWVSRYQEISLAAERRFWLGTSVEDDMEQEGGSVKEERIVGGAAIEPEVRNWREDDSWEERDEQLAQLVSRFLPIRFDSALDTAIPFRLDGYELVGAVRVKQSERLPTVRNVYVASQGLQSLLKDLISVLTIVLILALLWSFRNRLARWVEQPAIWLFGFFLLAIRVSPMNAAAIVMGCVVFVMIASRWGWYRWIRPRTAKVLQR